MDAGNRITVEWDHDHQPRTIDSIALLKTTFSSLSMTNHELVPLGTQDAVRELLAALGAGTPDQHPGDFLQGPIDRLYALVEGVERTHTPSDESRGYFLAGVGTLPASEVKRWAEHHGAATDDDLEPDAELVVCLKSTLDLATCTSIRDSLELYGCPSCDYVGIHGVSGGVGPWPGDGKIRCPSRTCEYRTVMEPRGRYVPLAGSSEGHTLVPNEISGEAAAVFQDRANSLACRVGASDPETQRMARCAEAFREAAARGGRPQWPGTGEKDQPDA